MSTRLGAIDHIGIAVSDLNEARKVFCEVLGIPCSLEKTLPERQVKIAFLSVGNTTIELLQGIGENSTVSKFVAQRGPGIHHICFEVEDIEAALKDLSEKGMQLADEHARLGAEGKMVAFLHPKSTLGVLVELVQK